MGDMIIGWAIVAANGKVQEIWQTEPTVAVEQYDRYPDTKPEWVPHRCVPLGDIALARSSLNYQERVEEWMKACFGAEIATDTIERNHRFIEEALEVVQSCGMTRADAHALVDYVYNRPAGDPAQEVGGAMVTLAALCLARGLDMRVAGETELARVWTMIDMIRAKQATKPRGSALPVLAVEPWHTWLTSNRFVHVSLSHNEHRMNYETASEEIERHPDMYEGTAAEVIGAMRDSNTIWTLQIYPDTPVGSYQFHGATSEQCFERAMAKFPKACP